MDQRKIYNDETIYADYAQRDYLFKPEKQIIKDLAPRLAQMRMLDMGVGGGRTTKYFAPLVKEYKGADYAVNMVQVCNEKFGGKISFTECDARNMEDIENDAFDFVLFSYNGMDSFGHEDRKAAFKEIHRILRHDGIFCFSSHNLGWEGLYDLFRLRTSKRDANIFKGISSLIKRSYRIFRLNFLNGSFFMKSHIERLREQGYGLLYDNSLKGRAVIYYITYQEQLMQLKEAGFYHILAYSTEGICTSQEKELNRGGWIYYVCNVRKQV